MIETIIVMLIVITAAAWLARRCWRFLRGRGGGCGGRSPRRRVALTIGGRALR